MRLKAPYKLSLLTLLVCSCFQTTFAATPVKAETSKMYNNGVGVIYYPYHGFNARTDNPEPIESMTTYFSQAQFANVKIVYLDGFNVTGSTTGPSTVPALSKFPNYTQAIQHLHALGKTVLITSALGDDNVNLQSGTVIADLKNIVEQTGADGFAIDDEISKASQTYFSDNLAGLETLANDMTSANKYFGIITNLGGSQEGALAPLYANVNCKASADAPNYCFETIMRYDQGTDGNDESASLQNTIKYIAKTNEVSFYQDNSSSQTHQPIIRIMVPGSYSANSYPTVDSDGTSVDDPGYNFTSFMCDLTTINQLWHTGQWANLNDSCPSDGVYYVSQSTAASLNLTGKLFPETANKYFVYGGMDVFRVANQAYAAASLYGETPLNKDVYLCNPNSSDSTFACTADYADAKLQKWVPNIVTATILFNNAIAPSTTLTSTSHFINDTEEKVVVNNGKANESCTLNLTDPAPATKTFSLDSNGSGVVSLSLSNITDNISADGETDHYAVTCTTSGTITGSFVRYGDKLKLCFTPNGSGSQTCLPNLFNETAAAALPSDNQFTGGDYTISWEPKLLNNTQQCDSNGYCDKILQPVTNPASTITVNGDVNLSLSFSNQTSHSKTEK